MQEQAAREWNAIAASAGATGAPDVDTPANEFLNAANKLQVKQAGRPHALLCH
jgi:hypothetical protein